MRAAPIPTRVLDSDELLRMNCAPVPTLVYMVLLLAIRGRANEILIEPREHEHRIAYRLGESWVEVVPAPVQLGGAISQVIKVLAELDICDSRLIQVGGLRLEIGTGAAELLVSIKPTSLGEIIHVAVESNTTAAEDIRTILAEWDQGRADSTPPRSLWSWLAS